MIKRRSFIGALKYPEDDAKGDALSDMQEYSAYFKAVVCASGFSMDGVIEVQKTMTEPGASAMVSIKLRAHADRGKELDADKVCQRQGFIPANVDLCVV